MNENNMFDISSSSSSSGIQQAAKYPSIDEMREKLIQTAEMERLTEVLHVNLLQCGWENDVQSVLRAELRKNKNKDLTLQELFELVREKAINLVPIEIEQDMVKRIAESYSKDLPVAKEAATMDGTIKRSEQSDEDKIK